MKRPVKVLYVEDDELDRRAFVRLVRDKGLSYEVTAVETIAQARERLGTVRFDIIVADYHLPDGLCTELFDEQPDTPIILMTGTLGEQLALRALDRQAGDYLAKDPQLRHLEALPSAVEKTLHRQHLRESEQRLTRQLREAHDRIASLLENISDGFAALDHEWRYIYINPAGARMVHQQPDQLAGRVLWEVWPKADESVFGAAYRRAVAENVQLRVEGFYPEPLNAWFEVRCYPSADGLSLFYTDITARKEAEQALRASLAEKEVLLQEIHHRVKNNMQVISSLLRLQSGYLKHAEDRAMLQECQDRVRAMALIHERLYESKNFTAIDFGEHIRELVTMVVRTYQGRQNVRLELHTDRLLLDLSTAIPASLIVNELVSNALKHAFQGRTGGSLCVEFRAGTESDAHLRLADDGAGLPEDFDWQASPSLGLKLVRMLTTQMHGQLTVHTGPGTEFRLSFPVARHPA